MEEAIVEKTIKQEKNMSTEEVSTIKGEVKTEQFSFELLQEIDKMKKRNITYFNIKNNNTTNHTNNKIIYKKKKKTKNVDKTKKLKKLLKAGSRLEQNMIQEISERRKKNKSQKEKKKAKKLEGEIKVGKMTVIKDISKIRKCDKKHKGTIFKLSSDAIQKIMKNK
ncbi:conserved protein, unknown function [Hepatocystis sp. ex Piliocolobus tephrosceles]|nr:conserved protein, unknown function [Hepatocystis sp. ex Piliocolobus tephrosceles]